MGLHVSDNRLRDLIATTQNTRAALTAQIKRTDPHDPLYPLLYHNLVDADVTIHCLDELLDRRIREKAGAQTAGENPLKTG